MDVQTPKIEVVISYVNSYGGLEFAESKMIEYKKKAEAVLNSYPESEARQSLLDLVEFTVSRKK